MSEVTREEFERLREGYDELKNENEQLRNRVDDLEAENDQLQDRVDDLEKKNKDTHDNAVGAHERLNNLKERLADLDTPTPDTGGTTVQRHDTPIEQVVSMPDHMVEDQLTANQQRARFIAKDIKTYASKASGTDATNDYLLTPSDLRTVLKSAFDISHSETVDRVRSILADLGGDEIRLREKSHAENWVMDEKARNQMRQKQGKMLVVKPALANRLTRIDHDVVTGAEA